MGLTLLFWICSMFFIWNIEIYGNYRITVDMFEDFLETNQVYVGMRADALDIQTLEKEIRREYPFVTWASARLNGTKLEIYIKENDAPLLVEADKEVVGTDLVADCEGKIVSMIVRSGVPKVKIGDAVEAGSILVEGKVPVYNEDTTVREYLYVDADADVTIRTEYPMHREISRYYRHKNYTGNEFVIPYIRFGQHYFSFLIYRDQYSLYDVIVKEHTNEVFEEFSIPIYWGVRRYCEYVEIEDLYGDEEGIILLKKFLEQTVEELREKGVQIIENNVKIETNSQYLKLTGHLLIDVVQQEY